jgi:hypothetical protein
MAEFTIRLSYKSWECIFGNNDNMDVDSLFNIFLNNYLRIVYTSFPLQKIIERGKSRQWITMGIKTSCNLKRQLYSLCKDSNDINLIKYYKQYCKILSRVITEAKRAKYNNQIINSTNKMKTTWNIIKSETNRLKRSHINYENSSDSFNDHFLSIAERIIQSVRHSDTESINANRNPMYVGCSDTESINANRNPMYYMPKISHNPFPNIKFDNTSTKEIERIINSIKVMNSHGYDGITKKKMLKASAPYICSPLNYICNKSKRSGTFPSRLKYSIIQPLFKKGDGDNMVN